MTFDDIAAEAWQRSKTALHRLYEALLGPDWDVPQPEGNLTLTSHDGQIIACRICGRTDKWHLEGDLWPVYVCEHEPIVTPLGALRQIDSVRYSAAKVRR